MAHEALGGDYAQVFNGVELEPFRTAEPHATKRPTVLFLGRHEPRKGLEVLLEALVDLPQDLTLWLAGDGPQTDELVRRFAGDPRVEWLGRISDEEKLARLVGADVFCAPSLRGESFGIVLLEAMAARTPVVASDLPGYANVARAGRDALLVPPGDAAALAAALRQVLDDPPTADRLVASGTERAEHFSMARLAARYLELYGHVVR
jgi:phosphatidylinositol alpha-mannosyltransferase